MSDYESKSTTNTNPVDASGKSGSGDMEFIMGWYGRPIAKLKYSGVDFGFDYESGWMLPLESYADRLPGKDPMFLRSFLPTWVDRNNDKNANAAMAKFFETQERFLSNIAIVKDINRLGILGYDHLHCRLRDFTSEDGVFTGKQGKIDVMTRAMETNISEITREKQLTQISGAQTKISMYLSPEGELAWQRDQPSTHIIKYAGFGGDPNRVRGAAEWSGMTLARAGGVSCADFALIEMPSEAGTSLNYLTERFDLPVGKEDERLVFCEEVGASMGKRPIASDVILLNDVIDGIMGSSTNRRADMADLFKQVAANCILENADFHARNMSLLKVAAPTLDSFRSVRLSPAYDVMRTREFAKRPVLDGEREPMRLSFSDDTGANDHTDGVIEFDKPTVAQFQLIGRAMGMNDEQSEKALNKVSLGMLEKAIFLRDNQPEIFDRHEKARDYVIGTSEVVIKNVLDLFPGLRHVVDVAAQVKQNQSKEVFSDSDDLNQDESNSGRRRFLKI